VSLQRSASMPDVSRVPAAVDSDRPFVAGGEMGNLMRSLDWSATPVGPPSSWPQSLRTTISILLDSRFPMLVLWGPELVQFYNDAFRPILGRTKHPAALGQPARECWSEIWDVIGTMFDGVMLHDQATFAEDLLFFLDRNGYLEETYFTFCYSAIRDETYAPGGVLVTCVETTSHVIRSEDLLFFLDRNGYLEETYFTFCYSAIRDETYAPGGVLVTCVETTSHVIGERRLNVLRELAAPANDAQSIEV